MVNLKEMNERIFKRKVSSVEELIFVVFVDNYLMHLWEEFALPI